VQKSFEQITINDEKLKELKVMMETQKKPVILLPSFKSTVDFAMLTYIHVMYEMDVPIIHLPTQAGKVFGFSSLFRRAGGFFIDQDNLKSKLYEMILEEMLGEMMKNNIIQEFYIERKRQRSGKLCYPHDRFLAYYINAFLKNQEQIEDVILVPVTINYEKVFEAYKYPYELLGEDPPSDRVFRAFN